MTAVVGPLMAKTAEVDWFRRFPNGGTAYTAQPSTEDTVTTEHVETTVAKEYQVRHPSGRVLDFTDIGDAVDHHVIYGMGSGPIFERTVTTTVARTDWAEVTE